MQIKTPINNWCNVTNKIKTLPYKLMRELNKIPQVQNLKEQCYQKALFDHSQYLPNLDSLGKSIVETLETEGTYITDLEMLGLPTTNKMLSTAYLLAEKLKSKVAQTNQYNNYEIGSEIEDIKEFPEILLWALELRLLDIVENYIGLPILYQYFALRRSIANGQYMGVRRWHLDMEDRRTIKIIIYLNDVDSEGGPYQYIPRKITKSAIKQLNYYNLGYISDDKMASSVPKSNWVTCLGKAGTVIISDTSSVFHRAQPPTQRERYSISFCYTSTSPYVTWKSREMTTQQWDDIAYQISQRQKDCLKKKSLILL